MSQNQAAKTIQVNFRRWLAQANRTLLSAEEEGSPISYASSSDTEWDEDSLVGESYGRATYNFSGGTTMRPVFGSRPRTSLMDISDDDQDMDYPYSDDEEEGTTICGW
jgi:hypothetical protein